MTAPRVPEEDRVALVSALVTAGQSVATCESLTAGLAAAMIADVPGASAVLRGGLITYATDLKQTLADVDPALLDTQGPVSPETAAQMALGARHRCGADWAVSLTGVAGPTPQDGHPVGEVFLGIAAPDGTVESLRVLPGPDDDNDEAADGIAGEVLQGTRWEIRRQSVDFALHQLLLRVVEQNSRKNR